MELDGLSSNTSSLVKQPERLWHMYLRTFNPTLHHSKLRETIYLSSLTIRTEDIDFQDEGCWERNTDDMIRRQFPVEIEKDLAANLATGT
jgi:hypothetical protein